MRGEGLRPRALDDAAGDVAATPEVGLHRLAEPYLAGDDGPVREGERKAVGVLVPLGPDAHERPVLQPREEPPVLAHEVEAAVRRDPVRVEGRLLGMMESQALDGRDREAADRTHVVSLVP
jgi:hypothetical protein